MIATEPLTLDTERLLAPPAGRPVLVTVPAMRFLAIDGGGDPNTGRSYQDALEALFSVSYTLRFALRRSRGLDYRVSPLETLWWVEEGELLAAPKSLWRWTAMIRQHDSVTAAEVADAARAAGERRPLLALDRLRLVTLEEGECAQVMHVGPYSAEGPTIAGLHRFIEESGRVRSGRHHEIYLGDPRRCAPERLRTIVRQPVAPPA